MTNAHDRVARLGAQRKKLKWEKALEGIRTAKRRGALPQQPPWGFRGCRVPQNGFEGDLCNRVEIKKENTLKFSVFGEFF